MTSRRITWFLAGLAALGGSFYLGLVMGTNGALGRGAFLNGMIAREEAKCFPSGDLQCLKIHWDMRAGLAKESARSSLQDIGPSSVEAELRDYIQWAEHLPPVTSLTAESSAPPASGAR